MGPNYLKHAPSFRALGYKSDLNDGFSWSEQAQHGWARCKLLSQGNRILHHSCLERYEKDGNINLIPNYYPGSRSFANKNLENKIP